MMTDRQADGTMKLAKEAGQQQTPDRHRLLIMVSRAQVAFYFFMLPFQSRMHPSIDETEGLADHVCLNLETKAGRQ
jgi:hypothetical protein